ncbi:hypothetical protein B0A52_08661 [Exophiala mesophila]|uniref:Asp/Glu/hydantoin racemase n=1 Tax=Exophiala mesophila TaxID=212818 RepID=A0A438MYF9_EXOME|nr:hypothetical protein B0A52_08661 [Exophiala mesophila]
MEKSQPRHIKLGILVPSSNTALEPLTQSIITSTTTPETGGSSSSPSSPPLITVHFSRFTVTEISLSNSSLGQFKHDKIIAAAQLLADAGVDVIGWSGTSAGWLGFQHDTELCSLITSQTGIPATSSVLALNQLLTRLKVTNLGMVTPYLDEMNRKIVENYQSLGIKVTAVEKGLGIVDNHEIRRVGVDVLDRLVGEVVEGMKKGETDVKLTVLSTFCTNLSAAQRVSYWEEKYDGLIVLDSVSTVVWGTLHLLGLDTSIVKGWGKMFDIK